MPVPWLATDQIARFWQSYLEAQPWTHRIISIFWAIARFFTPQECIQNAPLPRVFLRGLGSGGGASLLMCFAGGSSIPSFWLDLTVIRKRYIYSAFWSSELLLSLPLRMCLPFSEPVCPAVDVHTPPWSFLFSNALSRRNLSGCFINPCCRSREASGMAGGWSTGVCDSTWGGVLVYEPVWEIDVWSLNLSRDMPTKRI